MSNPFLETKMDQMRISSMSDDIGGESLEGVLAATSILHQRANEIRSQRVNWQSYLQSQMITQEDYNFIVALDGAGSGSGSGGGSGSEREKILKENRLQCAKTFLALLSRIAKDQAVQYLLILVDDLLNEDKSRVEIFHDFSRQKKLSVWTPFLSLLTRNDGLIQNMTSRIIAKIACWSREPMDGSDLKVYLTWLKEQLRIPGNEYLQSVARCLQMMVRIDEYRTAFVNMDGISTIVFVLSSKVNFQIHYQLTFCLWIMTFNPLLASQMGKFNVIHVLGDILSDSVKEKVTRIIVATFRNLIEKPEEKNIQRENSIAMVQCKVLKQLEILQQSGQKFEDPDIKEDMEFLSETLKASVIDLSSFDEYTTEVKSGRLEWSPVHTSEKFWRENSHRLNEKNYELLKILIQLLESSRDPLVLSVAAHDIGEYVRHYSRGKAVVEGLGGKHLVMTMLAHEDPNVRYEALLCVQKLMVQHWEYLGRQLEKDAPGTKEGKAGKTVSAKA